MEKLIGVTCSVGKNEQGVRAAMVNEPYLAAVRAAGGIPVALFDGEPEAEGLARRLDALLLTGGMDIDPALYGQENRKSLGIDARRDAFELALCHAFAEQGKPVLGICRGHQILAVAFGGTLYQDIGDELGIEHPSPGRHAVLTRPECRLRSFWGQRHMVNSTHHQAVRDVPYGFMVSALSETGIIEAMETTDGRPIFSVQFHPERLYQDDPDMLNIFRLLTGPAV